MAAPPHRRLAATPASRVACRRPGISRRPLRPALPRRRRRPGPLGPGSRPSPGESPPPRGPLGPEGSGPARRPRRPPAPDHPPDPAQTPKTAHPQDRRLQGKRLLGQKLALVLDRRRRRAPRHGPPRTPRSAWSGQARRFLAHRRPVLPSRTPKGRSHPHRAPRGQVPPRNRQTPGQELPRQRASHSQPAAERMPPREPQGQALLRLAAPSRARQDRTPPVRTPAEQAQHDRAPPGRAPTSLVETHQAPPDPTLPRRTPQDQVLSAQVLPRDRQPGRRPRRRALLGGVPLDRATPRDWLPSARVLPQEQWPPGWEPVAQVPQDRGPRHRRLMGRAPAGRPLGRELLSRRCPRGRRPLRLMCPLGLGWLVSGLRGICWRSRSA